MIPPASPDPSPASSPRRDRWLQSWLVALAATLVLLVFTAAGLLAADPAPVGNAAAAGPSAPARDPLAAGPRPALGQPPLESSALPTSPPSVSLPAPTASPSPAASPSAAAPEATTVFPAAGVLALPGRPPVRGTGQFEFAPGRSPVAGTRGPVRRYRVAVEKGSNEDARTFAAQVSATLSDKRSWIGNGRERLQMVTGAERADFTVYLATRDTAGRMCARGGTNIRIGGVPYTSCRTTGAAIINLDRWRGSAPTFVEAGTDLATYRQYVINHEVGHELGHRHENCPKAGGPAPVMVQQTITLRGCVPYAWPRRNGRDFSGPLR